MTEFEEKLTYLNTKVLESLRDAGFAQHIEGNLFYEPRHAVGLHLDPGSNRKRKRIADAVKNKNTMFEIGINGGHSSFLA